MPIFFIGAGILLVLTGAKGDPDKLLKLVQGEFTGPHNYAYWMVSILVLGALGYVEQLRNISRLFMVLVVIVLLLDNEGFFPKLQAYINSTQQSGSQQK